VCSLIYSDPDAGDSLQFSIINGNFSNGFAIDPVNGNITINNPNAVCFEGHPLFNLSVKVQDSDGLSSVAGLTINVDDINEVPRCGNQVFSVNENTPEQTLIGTIVAVDPDINQSLTYTIISGNTDNAFSLEPANGKLYVNNAAYLNFEANQMATLIVAVQDNGTGNLSALSAITIKIVDINEPPTIQNQTFSVMEKSPVGTEIGQIQATDPDFGQVLNYTIISGDNDNAFTLDPGTGKLYVNDPDKILYAATPIINLVILVSDNGDDSLSVIAFITVNLIEQQNGQIIYIDPTNENDPAENGSILHPYDSWNDFTFENGKTYLQKRATTFKLRNTILIPKKSDIIIDVYGSGAVPVIYIDTVGIHGLEFEQTKNCLIRNFEFVSEFNGKACIALTGEVSSDISVENCLIHDATYGIYSETKVKGLNIINTTIHDIGLDGIFASDFGNVKIEGCNIFNTNQNWLRNSNAEGSCINLSSNHGTAEILRNELDHSSTGNMAAITLSGTSLSGIIENNTLKGGNLSGSNCIDLYNTNGTFTVRYNSLEDGETGVNVDAATCMIYYNRFIRNQVAIKVQKNRATSIANNTFVGNSDYTIESFIGSKVSSKNNIFYLTQASYKTYKFNGTFVSDFNTYNVEKPSFLNGFSTLVSWSAATGQDKHSMVADPSFEDILSGNFKIKSNSPCINKGSDLGLLKDYFGTLVPQAGIPDMGFFEVNSENIDPGQEIIASDLIEISVFPNPTVGSFKINLMDFGNQQIGIRILTMSGYQVYSSVVAGKDEVEINLENEKTGMYIVVISAEGQIYTKNVIVQQ
jgi:hypothetical protein